MDYTENENGRWDWQPEDYYLEDTSLDISDCLWDGVNQTEENLSYVFDETTPIKACGDLTYNVSDRGKSVNKEAEGNKESYSQVKRRRTLHFNNNDTDSYLCKEQMPSTFVKSKARENSMIVVPPDNLKWDARYSGVGSASSSGGMDQSSEVWISSCYNEGEIHFNVDDMNASGASDDQIDISEFCNIPDEMETETMQVCSSPAPRRVLFKGRKSYMQTPTKLVSSVAYPFALIKPCAVHGDVTLKDINQKILTPPPKTKEDKEDSSVCYPTSAFSGKPVVVKTKIRTEGGKGSITIMRTKG